MKMREPIRISKPSWRLILEQTPNLDEHVKITLDTIYCTILNKAITNGIQYS
jgi:hypothetical protein